MNPVSVRPAPTVAPAPGATPDAAAPAGFAALLDAAREPAAATTEDPAHADAPADGATEEPAPRTAKATRKPHAPPAKGRREDSRTEPLPAIDVAALLQAQATPVEATGAAADAGADANPMSPSADAAAPPLPGVLPTPPVAIQPVQADAAPNERVLAAPGRGARGAAGTDPLPSALPDAAQAAAARGPTERGAEPSLEPSPGAPVKAGAPYQAATPNLPETTPGAVGLAAPPWPAPAAPAAASAPAPLPTHLAAALDSPAFAPALATQVRWLVEGGVQTAQLTLNPAEMGPVAVRIAIEGTQARIDFMADLAPTRAALETSLPTLAAALADGGLTLAGGGVFDGSSARQPSPDGQGPARGRPASANAGLAEAATRAAAATPATRGLVDLVA